MQRLSLLESLMAGGFIFGIAWVILMGASVKSRESELTPSTIEWTTKAEDVPAIDPNPYAPPRRGNF